MSKSTRKGNGFARRVADHAVTKGFPLADRRVLTGSRDKGDIGGIPDTCIEAKACAEIKLAEFVDEARIEADNAGARWWACVISRRMKPVGRAYAVMDYDQFLAMLRCLIPEAQRSPVTVVVDERQQEMFV